MDRHYGDFPRALDAALRARQPSVAVFSLARPAQTSRDSLNKYLQLGRHRFDLVIVYHGINELRANNFPPELFRDDYGHIDWYWEANAVAAHPQIAGITTLPFAARRGWLLLGEAAGWRRPVGRERPAADWLAYGADVKSAASLRANLESILGLARERGDPVLLSTVAHWIPPDYSLERFEAGALDYAPVENSLPLEVWGSPAHVAAGLARHNQVIEALARERPGVALADAARRIAPGKAHFRDVCHLTPAGTQALVRELLAAWDAAQR